MNHAVFYGDIQAKFLDLWSAELSGAAAASRDAGRLQGRKRVIGFSPFSRGAPVISGVSRCPTSENSPVSYTHLTLPTKA